MPKIRAAGISLVSLLLLGVTPAPAVLVANAQTAGCGIPQAAFCDTFDTPSVNPGRAGALGPVWGASRVTGNGNLFVGSENVWADTDIVMCDGSVKRVHPPDDIQICNGQLRESIDDTGMNDLAMYPRQPFDIAGRTGVVAFDVSDDTMGGHSAWPVFSYTDQPVPAPSPSEGAFPGVLEPRNSLNISLAGYNGRCVTAQESWTTSNYQASMMDMVQDDCVLEPPQESFQMNHVEIHVSQSGWELWMSDAGSKNLKKVAHANGTVPLTRGLVWMKDVHYDAEKPADGIVPFDQTVHTFAWDNFGFDGPVLPRDLGVQLPDGSNVVGTSAKGYPVRQLGTALNAVVNPPGPRAHLDFSGPHALTNVTNASAALLEMNYVALDQVTFNYSVNGHAAHSQPWPSSAVPTWLNQTIALPVPPSELVNGANSIDLSFTNLPSNLVGFSNVDLILVGAGGADNGGGGGGQPTDTPTLVPSPSVTPTPGQQFSVRMNRGDSAQITCSGASLAIVIQTQNSDVLTCS